MTEEIQAQKEQKNTVATVGMWFSIIGLILTITLLGIPLLFLGFILGIIGLFYKPRKRARIAISIPLIVFIAAMCFACYIGKSVEAPANDFKVWTETELKQLEDEDFDEDRFENILQSEIEGLIKEKTEEDWKNEYEASTGSNIVEKGAYLFFYLMKQGLGNALEKYNNGELLEFDDSEDSIVDVDVEIENENNNEENSEEVKDEDVEVFDQSEKDDIEQIIDILE